MSKSVYYTMKCITRTRCHLWKTWIDLFQKYYSLSFLVRERGYFLGELCSKLFHWVKSVFFSFHNENKFYWEIATGNLVWLNEYQIESNQEFSWKTTDIFYWKLIWLKNCFAIDMIRYFNRKLDIGSAVR